MKPLFEPQESYFPNHYPLSNEFIEAIQDAAWTHREFDWGSDRLQYHNTLKPSEQQVVERCLLAISQIEVSVKTFWAQLGTYLPQPAFSDLGYVLASNEVVHAKAYSNLLVLLGLESKFYKLVEDDSVLGERHRFLKAALKSPSSDLTQRQQFIYSLVVFTLMTENTALFSQFYILSHLHRYKNYLPKVNQQLDYTIKEEQLHASVGIWLLNTLYEQYPHYFTPELIESLTAIIDQLIDGERAMINWLLEGYENDNLTSGIVFAYICGRMNNALGQLDFEVPVDIPIVQEDLKKTSWMDDDTSGLVITDFFHKKPTGYSENIDWSDLEF